MQLKKFIILKIKNLNVPPYNYSKEQYLIYQHEINFIFYKSALKLALEKGNNEIISHFVGEYKKS